MADGLRRSLAEIEGSIKRHPKESAAIGAVSLGGLIFLMKRKAAAPASSSASGPSTAVPGTLYTDPSADTGYQAPTMQGPAGPAGAPGAIGATGATGAAGAPGSTVHVPPTPVTTKPNLNNLNIAAPANVIAKYTCPAGYHFAPELGGTGNWVCRPNKGATGKNDIQAIKK